MLMTPLLFLAFGALSRRLKDKIDIGIEDEINEQGPVIIAGIGRFGQIVNRLVQSSGFETVVLDHDIRKIDLMRSFGIKSFLGDPTRPVTLRAAGLLPSATPRIKSNRNCFCSMPRIVPALICFNAPGFSYQVITR